MNETVRPSNQAGDRIHGFVVQRIEFVELLQAFFIELEHEQTGGRHIHIACSDTENVFGVVFRTVPKDSTGVAHILEHTVLCGSERYPVRDPFFSMLKRSLSTFMNAFTASDWTMYPFATQNPTDYYNLMGVYLDAVFHPLLDPLSFRQEGHRLGFAEDGRLTYKGVVYNEMKGAMSSAPQIMARSLLKELYPDTTYRFNSGGDPQEIPRLSYEDLSQFHRVHYHPSNAWFFTYGHLPLSDHLAFIQTHYLKAFDRIDPDTAVASQPRWTHPRTASAVYPVQPGEAIERKHQACVAWLLGDIRNTYELLALSVLNDVLLGNPASPLRKALIDSGLGSALSDSSGLDTDNRDTFFAAGLKNVAAEDATRIQDILFDTLDTLRREGIDKEWIESALHQIEFHRKEITNTPYPYGLRLLLGITGIWIHGGDPMRVLDIDADMNRLRAEALEGDLLEHMIGRFFLDNPHRVLFTLSPDPDMNEREIRRLESELLRLDETLSDQDRREIEALERQLELRQQGPEDVSCLPTLHRSDLTEDIRIVVPSRQDARLTCYDQPTSGICYLSAVFGAGCLPKRLIPAVPFFTHCLTQIGTRKHSYIEIARMTDRYTGGLAAACHARTLQDDAGGCLPIVQIHAKCLNRNLTPTLELVSELLCEWAFTDLVRLKNLVLEYHAALESAIVENGHRLAMSRASRHTGRTSVLSECWGGIEHILWVRSLAKDPSSKALEALADMLLEVAEALLHRANVEIAVVGEAEAVEKASALSGMLASGLKDLGETDGFVEPYLEPPEELPREGWTTATSVSFVAQSFSVPAIGHPDAAALSVMARMIRSLYLHREVREKGGAYGGFAVYNPEDGVFHMASYRDPQIAATLEAFRGAIDFIASGQYTESDVDEAVLQVCADIDKPDTPAVAAKKAFFRSMIRLQDDVRRRFKERLVRMRREDVLQAAQTHFRDVMKDSGIAVVSSDALLASEARRMPDGMILHSVQAI